MKKYTSQEIKEFISKPLFDERIILNKDTNWPKVSIVTPSYNQGQFLERTILSVLNQNYPNLEYIIMDGGSTDGSIEIIKRYEKYLTYWVSEKDKGQSDAINKGFQKSTGEILAYLNSDDTYLPGAFSKAAKAFQENSKADLVYGNIYNINEQDDKINELKLTKLTLNHFIFEGISLFQPATFWKKEIYDKVGGFNPDYYYSMDFDFYIRVVKKGRMIYLPEYFANFRIHQHSKTLKTLTKKKIQQDEYEHEKIIRRYLSPEKGKAHLWFMKNLCRFQRIFHYFIQGDIRYILKKCSNRLRGITFWDEIIKP